MFVLLVSSASAESVRLSALLVNWSAVAPVLTRKQTVSTVASVESPAKMETSVRLEPASVLQARLPVVEFARICKTTEPTVEPAEKPVRQAPIVLLESAKSVVLQHRLPVVENVSIRKQTTITVVSAGLSAREAVLVKLASVPVRRATLSVLVSVLINKPIAPTAESVELSVLPVNSARRGFARSTVLPDKPIVLASASIHRIQQSLEDSWHIWKQSRGLPLPIQAFP